MRMLGIVLIAFAVCIYEVDSHGGVQHLGELNFVCKDGWNGRYGNCYHEVKVPMQRDAAAETCHRQGGHLLWLENEEEYDYISEIAESHMFWIGLKYTRPADVNSINDASWPTQQDHDRTVDLREIPHWDINEPNQGDGSSEYIACGVGQKDKGLALIPCTRFRPFFCKYEACERGQTPCATGGMCYLSNDTCDGRYECKDQSDERDCRSAEQCTYYFKLTETAGSFHTRDIEDGTRCTYVIEAPIGQRISLTVPTTTTTLEKDIAFLEIWTGSPDLNEAMQMASLTFKTEKKSYISKNNFMTVLLIAGDVSTSRNGITLSWTTDIADISMEYKEIAVNSSWQYIHPPFSKENTPLNLELTWKLDAPQGEIIMYYMESYDYSEGAVLIVLEGGLETSPQRPMDPADVKRQFFASAASSLLVYWNSGSGMSGFKLWFKTGCNIEIDEKVGALQVPNFWEPGDHYPSDLTCTWTLTGGQSNRRGLEVNFIKVELDADPRTDTRLEQRSQDYIKIWRSPDQPESSESVTASGKQHSSGGYMKIKFKSDLIINQGVGFNATYSIDCPLLGPIVSSHTIINPASTSTSTSTSTYESTVTVTCEPGYKFDAAEYHNMASVDLFCKEGGIWTYNNTDDIRIPNCEVVQCGVPTEINNGYILSVQGTSYGKTATYECNDGFTKNPNTTAICNEHGNWVDLPGCTAATCIAAEIQLDTNGNYTVEAGNTISPGAGVDVNTVVKFECYPGYELYGSLRSYCQHSGWSDPKPECHRIYCPFPSFDHAQPLTASTELRYQDTQTWICMPGYGINGDPIADSMTVTCGSDRTMTSEVNCSDINECDNNQCVPASTRCENNEGSYKCVCLDGFQATANAHQCEDIPQCDTDNGGCDADNGRCVEDFGGLPGYHCECNQGYVLFTETGPNHGHSVAAGETGYRFGDKYYYNHTCVKVSCDKPADTSHATLLSLETLFHYQDMVEVVCEDGYHITGQVETVTRQSRTCGADGSWDNADFTCSARTCSTTFVSSPSPFEYWYDRETVSFGEEVVLTCKYTETRNITRHAICMFKDGMTLFGGDDITTCPVIDCGDPVAHMPSGVSIQGSGSWLHLNNHSHIFTCATGVEGESELTRDHMIQCKENGRWSFGTLRCSGGKCSDPGTPAEAKQNVTNYEVGQKLHFTCNRNGYQPVLGTNPYDQEYECVNVGGSYDWSPSLATLPVCTDVSPPEVSNVPSTILYRDKMDVANFTAPSFTDNFGVRSISVSDVFRSTDIVTERKSVTYTVEDYDGNVAYTSVVIEVIDRTNTPTLNCRDYLELPVNEETPSSYDVTQDFNTDEGSTLSFSRESVPVSVSEIGKHYRIDVTATNKHGTKSYCSFLVTYKATRCFKQTLYTDNNAVRVCGDLQADGTMTCTSTCKTNYLYGDGQTQKNFTCSGTNVWDMNYPHVFCLPSESPAYQFQAYVIHQLQYLSRPCEEEYKNAVEQNLNYFENKMTALSDCNNIFWDIIMHSASTAKGSTEFSSNFTVKLVSTDIDDGSRSSCIQAIKDNMAVFNFQSDNLYCPDANVLRPFINTTGLTTTEGTFDCLTSSYRLIESDIGLKCIPCGPGLVYDSDSGNCVSCPDGEYKSATDGNCVLCDVGTTPNQQGTDCIITCPEGFRSDNGLMPCTPCAQDSYWVDSQNCGQCNTSTSTSGREGVTSDGGCYAQCPPGTYSQTGYQDMTCHPCPQNFYQPDPGQTTCVACDADKVTDGTGKTDSSSCLLYSDVHGMTCDDAYCNNHGTCQFRYHRPVCTCEPGYHGDTCQESFHICDGEGSPCLNGGKCVPTTGGTFLQYTCECKVVKDNSLCYDVTYSNKEGGYLNNPISEFPATLPQCQTACLNNDACKSLSHYTANFGLACFLYDRVIPENELQDLAGGFTGAHYDKNCPAVFNGTKCENDLIDGCRDTNQCSEESMCKNTADVVNGYECLCPSDGGYTGEYCDQVATPCSNVTCQNGGNCIDHGNARFECNCREGYTGQYCETDIDECVVHPNACLFGVCENLENAYSCSCNGSFSGDRCQNVPNFCASNSCMGNVCYNSVDDQAARCHCEEPYFEKSGDFACIETSAQPCDNVDCQNGTCNNQPNYEFRCDCADGYTGSVCQHSVDDCIDSPCVHGQCLDQHQDVQCVCEVGYTGDHCETNINGCDPDPCDHGRCEDLVNDYVCHCEAGYTGINCGVDLDECLSRPCYNGGNCTDQVNGFTCQCMDGWTSDSNCKDWNSLCTPGYCNNNGDCYDLTDNKVCRCVGTTQGDTCEGIQSVCDTLSNVGLCLNSGTCQDDVGSAHCECSSVPDMDRCYHVIYKDKDGGNDGQIGNASTGQSLEECKQRCLDTPECKSLSYIPQYSGCLIYSLKPLESSLTHLAGAVHIEKDCPTDYTGKACEQVKNWCSMTNNPCQHNGQCVTRSDKGFECVCEEGYSGMMCEVMANPCNPSPCPTGATCRHNVTQHYCQCPQGREIMGGQCRSGTIGANLNLLVAHAAGDHVVHMRRRRSSHGGGSYYEVPEDLPRLKTAFRMSGDTLSVQFWVRVHSYTIGGPYNVLRLVGSEQLYPLQDRNPKLVLLIADSRVQLTYDSESIELAFDPLTMGEWYHIGVTLDADKRLWYTIKAVEVQEPAQLTAGTIDLSNLNAQLVFGDTDGVFEFNRVTVWETPLENSDFANALVDKDYEAPNAVLTQGWYNIGLTKASKILTADLSPDVFKVDKTAPAINCDPSPYKKTSSERMLRLSELQHLTQKIDAVSNTTVASVTHSIPDALTWGYYPGIVKVEANGRPAFCRFPVYIKHNDTCPVPVKEGDVTITPCDTTAGDGVCDLQCQSGQISAPRPKYQPCGFLGVYDSKNFWKNLVLPTCAVGASQKYVVDVSMQYTFSINCNLIGDIENSIKAEIRVKFKELNSIFWSEICMGDGCTNLEFQRVECGSGDESKKINLEYSLNFDSDSLTALKETGEEDGQLKLDDALKSIIVLENRIDLNRFASAAPDFTTVRVTMRTDCTTSGYNLINGICVPCGKGLVYNSTLGHCQKCPIGFYKGDSDMKCMSCGEGKTTINDGETSQDKCVGECDIGRFYDTDVVSCQNCPRHYYQDKVGQSFCHPCDLGYKTQGEGTNSANGCKADCDEGYERNATGLCVLCARGYWRDLSEDDCRQCDEGKTTLPGIIAIKKDKCSMDICAIGNYWSTEESKCKLCDYGEYQDVEAELQCKPCTGNRTTRNMGESSADNCIFYCDPGYEVNPDADEACRPCERGSYKDNNGTTKFDSCIMCENSKTTDAKAADKADLCEYEICVQGQYLVDKECVPCDKDYYQPMEMPDSSVSCTKCPNIGGTPQGTEQEQTGSESDCKPICPGGQYFDSSEERCVDCEQRSYKPDSDRFGTCTTCPDGFTTDVTSSARKTAESDCYIPLCEAGQYVKEETSNYVCEPCDVDKYQTIQHPEKGDVCVACPPTNNGVNQGTRQGGANSSDLCESVCPAGQEYKEDTDECVPCAVGKYKTVGDRFGVCADCDVGFTTDGEGKLSAADCSIRDCDPGSYDNGTQCVLCAYGYYQEKRTQTSCQPCGTNLNTSREGSKSKNDCQAFCGAGLQISDAEQPTNCTACPMGFYKAAPSYDPCAPCQTDHTSNEDRTACDVLFCSPGKHPDGEACVECVAGTYKNSSGNTACLDCPPGVTNTETGQTTCDTLHCEPGKYPKDGKCELCETGSYKMAAGNEDCTVCPVWTTTPGEGTVSEDGCSRVVCNIGSYREGETTCVGCPLNKYQDQIGQTGGCIGCQGGQVTMTTNSTKATDCVPECGEGQEYNATKRDCDPCKQRYYKDSVGNNKACIECPLDKTTVGTGSSSIADCTEDDCNPGKKVTMVAGKVVCVPCPKGEYQPDRSQTECITCPADKKTTENTGSTKLSQCIVQCQPGYELIYPIPDNTAAPCRPCEVGYYNPGDLNKCARCPEGFISSTLGQPSCTLPDPKPKPQPITVNLFFVFIYRVATTCSDDSLDIIQANIQSTILTGISKRRTRYTGLCGINSSSCGVLVNVRKSSCSLLSAGRRRKREVSHNLEVEVTMQNISNIVTDTEENNVLDTKTVVTSIIESNPDEFSPVDGQIEYGSLTAPATQTPVCEPGYTLSGDTCVACQPGTYWSSGTETCVNCTTNQYQDMEAMTSCKLCPALTYNDDEGSNSLNACKSYCVENPDYCHGHGNCTETGRKTASCTCATDYIGDRCDALIFCRANPNYCNGHGTCLETTPTTGVCSCDTGYFGDQCQNLPYCSEHTDHCNNRGTCSQDNNNVPSCTCNSGFYGNRCESKETPASDYNALVGGLVGGIGGLLVIILIVVAVVKCLIQKGKKERKHRYLEADENDYFRNPVYDNGSNAGSLPAVFQAMPAADYYTNPYEQYSYSSKRAKSSRDPSAMRTSDREVEDQYIWQA